MDPQAPKYKFGSYVYCRYTGIRGYVVGYNADKPKPYLVRWSGDKQPQRRVTEAGLRGKPGCKPGYNTAAPKKLGLAAAGLSVEYTDPADVASRLAYINRMQGLLDAEWRKWANRGSSADTREMVCQLANAAGVSWSPPNTRNRQPEAAVKQGGRHHGD